MIPNPHSSSNTGPYLISGSFLYPGFSCATPCSTFLYPKVFSREQEKPFPPRKGRYPVPIRRDSIATGLVTTSMVATRQDTMSNYNNHSSALELDDVQTPARYIAIFSFFAFDLNCRRLKRNCLRRSKLASAFVFQPPGLSRLCPGNRPQEEMEAILGSKWTGYTGPPYREDIVCRIHQF